MARLLLISNRLPVTVKVEEGRAAITPSSGGLATGLWGPHQEGDSLWLGWPGDVSNLAETERKELDRRFVELRTVPVYLSEEEHRRYYEGFANGVLWPLCHYLIDTARIDSEDFGVYRQVNERFADLAAEAYRPGDSIWVHDYHLMLLPGMLRRRLPEARIGFFLHIPFPSSEVFGILPWRSAILEGLLGADLIGFHTHAYMRHFAGSVLRILGVEARVDQLIYEGREVRIGAFPMGIDAEGFAAIADSPQVREAAEKIRTEASPRKLLVAIDRLDYTKGIPRRLLGFERFLERDAAMQDKVRLLQVAVPSRAGVEAYEALRHHVEELLGRINSRFATPSAVPIHSMYRSLGREDIVALYRAADVMVVTPLRDGLNLVAKEFCASRTDEDGVLVLSEFAGAAAELGEAIRVNPYDADRVADALRQALEMSEQERRSRMRSLRQRVFGHNVHDWVRSFLEALEEAAQGRVASRPPLATPAAVDEIVALAREASQLHLFLDYDGTLMPFAPFPELAAPDDELRSLLQSLARACPSRVYLLSGRVREDLDRWFGDLRVGLCAEHGLWLKAVDKDWTPLTDVRMEWKPQVLDVMKHFAARTPGAFIEEKTASAAWHYRNADREFGSLQAKELRLHLMATLSNLPVQVLQGEKVIEVRMHGVNKGTALRKILGESPVGVVIAIGDDRTDEDMFAALPPGGYAVHIGATPTSAPYCLADYRAARAMLSRLV